MERVGGAVGADETFALRDRIQKRGLSGGRHGRVAVFSGSREIASCIEKEGVEILDFFGCEDAAIFGVCNFKVVFSAELTQDFFSVAGGAAFFGDDAVFEPG